jgi:formate-dependent nitrite reductase membrane component NrfD
VSASYYGQPVLSEPTWTWEIPTYFFVGGMAGASGTFAALAELRGNELLARRAWLVALAGVVASPPLLIADLGRPERFVNMLRVFKPTSPMNMGSWILALVSPAFACGAARSLLGWFPRLGLAGAATSALAGPALATYTGVLVADTAIPVWHEARAHLPFVFAAGAAMSAASATALITPPAAAGPARRLALGSAVAELALTHRMERDLGMLAEPYRAGAAGRFARAAKALTAAGALTIAARRPRAGAVALLAGAFCARWSVYKAGFASARDPRYVVEPQRARS